MASNSLRAARRSRSPDPEEERHSLRRRRSPRNKRSTTACDLCRRRKTKCNAARPSCGYCLFNGVPCTYTDSHDLQQNSQQEPPNSLLLERLDHVVGLLQDQANTQSLSQDGPASGPTAEKAGLARRKSVAAGHSNCTDAEFGRLEISEAAARTVSCEALLQWPVFSEIVPHHQIQSLILVADGELDTAREEQPAYVHGLRPALASEDILPLCNRFQAFILPKNPFMTAREFMEYGRDVAENGPGWNGPSCLVVELSRIAVKCNC